MFEETLKKWGAAVVLPFAFFCTHADALSPVTSTDCVPEQKKFLELHVGGYYKENVENVKNAIQYTGTVSENGALSYLKSMEKQKANNEKKLADHLQKPGAAAVPLALQMDLASDALHICLTRVRLGQQSQPSSSESLAEIQAKLRQTNVQLAALDKTIGDFLKSAAAQNHTYKTQAIMWYARQRVNVLEQYCANCPGHQHYATDANDIFKEARESCMKKQNDPQACRPVAPNVLLAQ